MSPVLVIEMGRGRRARAAASIDVGAIPAETTGIREPRSAWHDAAARSDERSGRHGRRGTREAKWSAEETLPLRKSKLARILELAAEKDVLDVGCIGGHGEDPKLTTHARLAQVARECVGIDIVPEEVGRWCDNGYNVVMGDAETFSLGRAFDVVVAADVIEHLANPGRFLERVRAHVTPSGLLCIVTPNALSLNNALKSLAGLQVRVNPEHTCWFDRTTLRQLVERYGFRVVEEYWQDYQTHPLTALALRFRRNLAAHFVMIARHVGPGE